ncbi:21766_t:CDS:2 [Rhizophagus irregularis]|nr:21766_t:CDS:2 [Rhizophagus irregularis]
MPPNEVERRRALWRFHTSNDNLLTSISMISLLNTTHQWFKAEDSMGCSETTREISFCHAILQENGEPFILCWRSLRTDDGGTICVIDREPRDNFSKKDRGSLKEFAKNETEESIAEFSKFCLEIQLANNSNNKENKGHFRLDTPLPDVSSNNLRSLASAVQARSQGCIYQNSLPPLPTLFLDYVHSDIVVSIYNDT